MYSEPKLFEFIAYALLAAIAGSIVWATKEVEPVAWWQYLLILVALTFLAAALLSGLNWIAYNAAERMEQAGAARVRPVTMMAQAVRGLTTSQMDLLSRFDLPSVIDQYDGHGVTHLLRCTDGQLIDTDFVEDFLRQSLRRPGFLWPVREHQVFKDWVNTEQLCRSVTNSLVHWGMARPAVGNQPAEVLWSVDQIAARLGIDLD